MDGWLNEPASPAPLIESPLEESIEQTRLDLHGGRERTTRMIDEPHVHHFRAPVGGQLIVVARRPRRDENAVLEAGKRS